VAEPLLSCQTRHEPDAVVIVVRGELCLDSTAVLETAVQRALSSPPGRLILDCAWVTFCDSTGLSTLIKISARAESAGARLTLDRPSRQLRRLLDVTGLTTVPQITDEGTVADQPTSR
jgi:anti-anti-sigma factor